MKEAKSIKPEVQFCAIQKVGELLWGCDGKFPVGPIITALVNGGIVPILVRFLNTSCK